MVDRALVAGGKELVVAAKELVVLDVMAAPERPDAFVPAAGASAPGTAGNTAGDSTVPGES
ncbi:MAG: hypothetical protein Kow00122_18930 [Thermoleophilia bacterium]